MNQKLKIATLVISSRTYPAVRNMNMQKKLFFNQEIKYEDIFWYRQGRSNELDGRKYNLVGNDLFLDISDDTLNMGKKTLLAFDWLNNNIDYDFLVRPTPSSYIDYKNLNQYINDNFLNKEIVYGGKIQETNDQSGNLVSFASGSSLILNKRCVDQILQNQDLWEHDYWDDVGLALLLKKINIFPTGGERFDVQGNPYKQQIDLSYYQYRCRSDNHYGYPRIIEAHVLKAIHEKLSSKKKSKMMIKINSLMIEILKFFYIHHFGWKVYLLVRKVIKIFLPISIYNFIKKMFIKQITSFKLKRFKV